MRDDTCVYRLLINVHEDCTISPNHPCRRTTGPIIIFLETNAMFCHWVPRPQNPMMADMKTDLTLLTNCNAGMPSSACKHKKSCVFLKMCYEFAISYLFLQWTSVKGTPAYFTYHAYPILFMTALCHLDSSNYIIFRPTLYNLVISAYSWDKHRKLWNKHLATFTDEQDWIEKKTDIMYHK